MKFRPNIEEELVLMIMGKYYLIESVLKIQSFESFLNNLHFWHSKSFNFSIKIPIYGEDYGSEEQNHFDAF